MGADDIFDVLLLILVVAILAPIMIGYSLPMFKGDIGGFDTLEEKTAQKTNGEIKPFDKSYTREDILLMAIIADKKTPKPACFEIRGDKNNNKIYESNEISNVVTTDNLVDNRAANLNYLNDYIPTNIPLKIELFVGNSGMRKWVVSSK